MPIFTKDNLQWLISTIIMICSFGVMYLSIPCGIVIFIISVVMHPVLRKLLNLGAVGSIFFLEGFLYAVIIIIAFVLAILFHYKKTRVEEPVSNDDVIPIEETYEPEEENVVESIITHETDEDHDIAEDAEETEEPEPLTVSIAENMEMMIWEEAVLPIDISGAVGNADYTIEDYDRDVVNAEITDEKVHLFAIAAGDTDIIIAVKDEEGRTAKAAAKISVTETEAEELAIAKLVANWNEYEGMHVSTAFLIVAIDEESELIHAGAISDSEAGEELLCVIPASAVQDISEPAIEVNKCLFIDGYVGPITADDEEVCRTGYVLTHTRLVLYGEEAQAKLDEEDLIYTAELEEIARAEEEARIQAEEEERLRQEALQKEIDDFKESCTDITYLDLLQYPDSLKEVPITLMVDITQNQSQNSWLFGSLYMGMVGDEKIAIYDEREVREPRLLEGHSYKVYGYGDGMYTAWTAESFFSLEGLLGTKQIPSIKVMYID